MKRNLLIYCLYLLISGLSLSSCGGKDKDARVFPSDFNQLSDAQKTAYVMERVSPDSTARFICDAALGRVKGVKLSNMNEAVLYAYENYRADNLNSFSAEFNDYPARQPLVDKMKIYLLAGQEDPQGLGYKLGLEYVSQIRDKKMNADEVEKEIKALKKACGNDDATYQRFLTGFRTVLQIDHGKDLPEEIYRRFANYGE